MKTESWLKKKNKRLQKDYKMKLIIQAKCVILNLITEHPNIVKFEDLVESTNNIYFFMEYCSGGTLEKLL